MTTFVVSLFLPYTIDFEVKALIRKPSPPPRRASPLDPVPGQLILFDKHSRPLTRFPYEDQANPLFPVLESTSPSLHFTKPRDPQALARTDSYVPEWGHTSIFNQPRPQRDISPPPTVTEYISVHDADKFNRLKCPKRRERSKPSLQGFTGSWTVVPAVQGNGGLKNAIRAACEKKILKEVYFVGTLGCPTDALEDVTKSEIAERFENEFDALMVHAEDVVFHGHYNHYCKTILWPVFHYQIPDHPKSKAYEDHSFGLYRRVNEAFADRVIQSYKHGDVIWVHDYHLMLVPKLIRKRLPNARIGFFFHVAFPSSEIFRCLAQREALLEGVLGSNLVAFQTQEYAQHFLQTCSHLLFVEATEHGIQLEDRFVNVTGAPIGIVSDQLKAAREDPEVAEWTEILQEKYHGKYLVCSRDKLDATRGLKQKLLAYELFLDEHPEWREKVVLIQVLTSTSVEDNGLDVAISEIVSRIEWKNSTLAHQPVILVKQDIKFSHYLGLLTAADALLVTSLRDGLNLSCHEYLLCQDGTGAGSTKKYGPLILSEFTGSSALFGGAEISINPWDYRKCAEAIHHALILDDEGVEKEIRYKRLVSKVLKHSGVHWVQILNGRLEEAYQNQQQHATMSVPRLSVAHVSEQYKLSRSRFFILDYEGTLAACGSQTKLAEASPQRVIDVLTGLMSASQHNVVYVTSGKPPHDLEHVFRHIPGIGLIAENGCFIRPFNHNRYQNPEAWIELVDPLLSTKCKDSVKNVLEYYRERIEGSWIEERRCSLTFHYEDVKGDADIEAAVRQAGDCANHLNDSCQNLGIRAVPIDKGIVVELKDFSKKTASAKAWELAYHKTRRELSEETHIHFTDTDESNVEFMDEQTGASAVTRAAHEHASTRVGLGVGVSAWLAPQFLMVAGDDRDDEPVFRWANALGACGTVQNVVTVCVGKKSATEAKCTLTQGVTGLLWALQKLGQL